MVSGVTVPPHTKRGFLSLFLVCALLSGQQRKEQECWCASCAIVATHQFISYSVNTTERKEWGVFGSDFFHFLFTREVAATEAVPEKRGGKCRIGPASF